MKEQCSKAEVSLEALQLEKKEWVSFREAMEIEQQKMKADLDVMTEARRRLEKTVDDLRLESEELHASNADLKAHLSFSGPDDLPRAGSFGERNAFERGV